MMAQAAAEAAIEKNWGQKLFWEVEMSKWAIGLTGGASLLGVEP